MFVNFRHLEVFTKVADCGSMSKAAEELFLAQPTVSQVISDFESNCGFRLFERLSKRIVLTAEGESLLLYAKRILVLAKDMEQHIQLSASAETLRIGASVSAGMRLISTLIEELTSSIPNAKVQLYIFSYNQIQKKLLANQLDIALTECMAESPELVSIPTISDRLVLVCGNKHPFRERATISMNELKGQDFVLREVTSGSRLLLERFLSENNIAVREAMVCNNTEAIKLAVENNYGLSLISKSLIEQEISEKRLFIVEIDSVDFTRDFSLLYHKDKYQTQILKRFVEICSSHIKENNRGH